MSLNKYAKPTVWAPLLVAIGLGSYFIVAVEKQSAPSTEEDEWYRIPTASVRLVIQGPEGSAEVESPLSLERNHMLMVNVDLPIAPAVVRAVYLVRKRRTGFALGGVLIPEGVKPEAGWTGMIQEQKRASSIAVKLSATGFTVVVPGTEPFAVGEETIDFRLIFSDRQLSGERVLAYQHREWVQDPAMRMAITPMMSVAGHASDLEVVAPGDAPSGADEALDEGASEGE